MSMDSREYLKSYGWQEGEALKKGGLKKPILVKHKKDTKGLGHDKDQQEAWWERVFDGQLKALDIKANGETGSVEFKQNESTASAISKKVSPLYRMFVKGEGLAGTLGKKVDDEPKETVVISIETKAKAKKIRTEKKEKKDKKDKKDKNEKEKSKKVKEKKLKDSETKKSKLTKKDKKVKKGIKKEKVAGKDTKINKKDRKEKKEKSTSKKRRLKDDTKTDSSSKKRKLSKQSDETERSIKRSKI